MSKKKEITEAQKQKAAEVLHNNLFAKMIGMKLIEMKHEEATIQIEMRDELRQPHGLLHGGVTATLIDTAMAFAVITCLEKDEKASTVDLTVHYLRPHLEGAFSCTAKIVRAGKRLLTVSADVFNEQGKLLATAISSYSKV
ncbi:MAG TPA: PaaI family thioesterase [Pyrinomonadaceae bacterium]|nr:PaaI family thioesterase [Pyrinomonadaceae bacterium]